MKACLLLVAVALVVGPACSTSVEIDPAKLRSAADALGVTSFLEVQAKEEPSQAALPADLESGNFEIKCSTSCAFVKAGSLMKAASGGQGTVALKAAEVLAEAQEKLKKLQDAQNEEPNNAALQSQIVMVQSEVNEKTAALQAAVGATQPKADLEGTAVALAAAEKKLEQLEVQRQTAPSPQIDAEVDLAKAEVEKLKASVDTQKNIDSTVDQELGSLQDRLAQLKAALEKAPGDATIKEQLDTVQAALDEKQKDENAFTPKKECYRVCMNHQAPPAQAAPGGRRLLAQDMMFAGDVNNCVRMCVKVMRHLVYNMAQKFL